MMCLEKTKCELTNVLWGGEQDYTELDQTVKS